MSSLKLITLRERCFSSCHECGTKKKFWVPTRNWTSDLRIPRSDSLSYFYVQTWLYRHCWSLQYVCVSYELSNKPHSLKSLCGSVVWPSERGIRWSEVRFLMGSQDFFHCPMLVRRWKTSFSISLSSSKLTISLILLIKLVGKLLRVIIGYTYTSLLVVYLPYIKAS